MYSKQDPTTIQAMFNSIARRYDRANHILSLRLHQRWNRTLIDHILQTHPSHTLVDLCCGTGDIALEYLKSSHVQCQAYFIDFSAGMLQLAKTKSAALTTAHQLHFIESDVQHLPLIDTTADCISLAYGIRNVKDPRRCLKEAYRILKPGGTLGILELTEPKQRFLRLAHRFYLQFVLPLCGKLITSNQQAYKYLQQSIHSFIAPDQLEQMMKEQGFHSTYRRSLSGGIATIFIGYK